MPEALDEDKALMRAFMHFEAQHKHKKRVLDGVTNVKSVTTMKRELVTYAKTIAVTNRRVYKERKERLDAKQSRIKCGAKPIESFTTEQLELIGL